MARDDLPSNLFERLAKTPYVNDPYTQLQHLCRMPAARMRTGELVLVGHAEVSEVLRSRSFAKPELPALPLRSVRTLFRMFLMLNDPDHHRLRHAVAPAFSPAAVASRQQAVRAEVEALVGRCTTLEAVSELAYPLPLNLICSWLGARPEDQARIGAWSRTLTAALDSPMPLRPSAALRYARAIATHQSQPVATLRAARSIVAYATRLITDDDHDDTAELLKVLRRAVADGTITIEEAAATWVLLVIAGHETTANLIGNALALLAAHPEQLEVLQANPQLVEGCLDEVLGYESPVPLGIRIATETVHIAGHDLGPGDGAYVLFSMANRDPAVYDNPDRFDITRVATSHLAFGQGSHFCLGAQLARLEAREALSAIAPRMHIGPPAPVHWRQSFATRGVESVSLTLDAA